MKKEHLPVGVRFAIIARAFKKEMDAYFVSEDLTSVQFSVLRHVDYLEKQGTAEINQKMLEDAIHVTHPTMIEIIRKLERNNYITSHTSDRDRRQKVIATTDKAAQVFESMARIDEQVFEKLCRNLTAEQIQQMFEITDRLLDNICISEDKE